MSPINSTLVNWILTGMAGALTLGRYAIRAYNSRRLYWDDLAHLVAFLLLVSHSATNEVTLTAKAELATLKAAKGKTPPAVLLHSYQHVHYLNTINNCLLYMVFWAVKVSLLLFYHQLFRTSITFRRVWWAVLAFTLLTFWVPIAGVLATCSNAKTIADYKVCDGASHSRLVKLTYTCVINVASDLAIMALPLWMLKNLKIRPRQKVGLALIFSLAIFIVALDILRTAQAAAGNQALYTVLEINFAVIVSCLPTYRALLTIGQKRTTNKASKMSSYARKSMGNGRAFRGEDGRLPLRSQEDVGTEMQARALDDSERSAISRINRDPYSLKPFDRHGQGYKAPEAVHFQRPGFSPAYSNLV